MPPKSRNRVPPLTDSWASMDDEGANTEPFSSEDEGAPPRADMTSSRVSHLEDALGEYSSRRSLRPDLPSGSRPSPQNSVLMESMSASNQQSPRKRGPQSRRTNAEPSFVMPSIGNSTSGRMSASTPAISRSREKPTPGQSRNSGFSRNSPKVSSSSTRHDAQNAIELFWTNMLLPLLQYAFSVVQLAAGLAKPIIAYGLALWLLVGCLIMARNFVTSSMTNALAPLCHIPGAGLLGLPFCASVAAPPQETGPVEFDKLVAAQAAFEDILTTSAGGASLPLDMKRSEASIRDLKHVVQYSTLPSRNELVFEFTGFIDTARQASADLSKYNSRIGRAVDRILTTNRWTLQVLDGIAETEAAQGSIIRFISTHLDVLAPFRANHQPLSQAVLFDQYIHHTSAIEDQVQALILEAQALLSILQNLDNRLDTIGSIATRDGVKASGSRDELLAFLWTKLGGNRSSVSKLESQLAILRDVGSYRKMAWAHVSGTILKLQDIAANLEDLRERVARPEVVGLRKEIPLSMHVEEILMGVERLEAVRTEGRRIEDRRLRAVVDRGEQLAVKAA